jgi:co-chaperonin GroES (HSP10)
MKKYKVLFDNVAVKPLIDPGVFKKEGGLFLRPEMRHVKYLEAEVRATGEKVKGVKKGDRVICDDWLGEAGTHYRAETLNGEKVIYVKERDILAKLGKDVKVG